jgi:hypothetical protein
MTHQRCLESLYLEGLRVCMCHKVGTIISFKSNTIDQIEWTTVIERVRKPRLSRMISSFTEKCSAGSLWKSIWDVPATITSLEDIFFLEERKK